MHILLKSVKNNSIHFLIFSDRITYVHDRIIDAHVLMFDIIVNIGHDRPNIQSLAGIHHIALYVQILFKYVENNAIRFGTLVTEPLVLMFDAVVTFTCGDVLRRTFFVLVAM